MALAFVFVLAGCLDQNGEEPRESVPQGNLLSNPGLENGSEPWITLAPESGFVVTDEKALSGSFSALERMLDAETAEGSGPTKSKVYYLVQEIVPDEFPEVVRGNYLVENWVPGTDWQYLQFVIIAERPANFPAEQMNYQIRYPLAGIDSQPFPIENAKFRIVQTADPEQGKWIPFEARVKDDFDALWGMVPEGFTKLRLLFEVRWDWKVPGRGAPSADVYYDDLYAGPG
jgi:hypothetical protein